MMQLQPLVLTGVLAIGCADPLTQNPLQPDQPLPFDGGVRWSFDSGVDVPPDAFQQPFRRDVPIMDVRPDVPRDMDCIPARCEGGVILRERAEIDDAGVRQELCVRFPEMSSRVGLTSVGEMGGVLAFDVNGDGRPDLLVLKRSQNPQLFQNTGGSFLDVTTSMGLREVPPSVAVAAGDYDGDGDQDLFFAGTRNLLFRNDGGVFVRVEGALSAGDEVLRGTAAVFARPYLLFGTDNGTRAYRYDGGRFMEATRDSGLEDRPGEAADFAVTRYEGRTHIYGSSPNRVGKY